MKIIFSTYDSLENPYYAGGGAFAIHEVAKRLAKENQVKIFTGKFPNSVNTIVENVNYEYIGTSIGGPKFGQLVFLLTLPYKVLTTKFDVWLESFTPPISTMGLQLFTRKPVIGLCHLLSGKEMSRKYKIPFNILENIGLKFYKNIIALSNFSKTTMLKQNSSAKITVISNGVNLPKLNDQVQNSKDILFMGRLEAKQKGLDLLLTSLSLIKDRFTGKLIIAGSGSAKDLVSLRVLVRSFNLESKVVFVGRVSGTKKEDLFNRASLLVLPSRYETLPLVILEAFSYAKPVICFDLEFFKELPNSGMIKVKPFDCQAFGDAILELVNNPDKLKEKGDFAREYIKNYDWNIVTVKYSEFIQQVVKEQV